MSESFKWRLPKSRLRTFLNSATFILFVGSIIYTILIYPSLPEEIPINFNLEGEADGWGSKATIFMFPLIIGPTLLMIYLLSRFSYLFHFEQLREVDKRRYISISQNTALFNTWISLTLFYSVWMVKRKAEGLSAFEPWSFYLIIGVLFLIALRLILQVIKGKENKPKIDS